MRLHHLDERLEPLGRLLLGVGTGVIVIRLEQEGGDADLLGEVIKRVHEGCSVGDMFKGYHLYE